MGRRTGTKASSFSPSTQSSRLRSISCRLLLRTPLRDRLTRRFPTYDGAVNATSRWRPYFFEIFSLVNFALLLFIVRRMTTMPLRTLGVVAPSVAGMFLLQALIGVAIRTGLAARKGNARELLPVYRTKRWIADTPRL